MKLELLAPAKLNLGLEVLGRRTDGFHEIATVFQTISVFDRVRMVPSARDSVRMDGGRQAVLENLVERALDRARGSGLSNRCWNIAIDKRIPMAAGLGGASADAAAALAGLTWESGLPRDSAFETALDLGSDVPFLLTGGAAEAHGRGELLSSLPSLRGCWFVLTSPAIELDRKTPRLYGALAPSDFSDGDRNQRVAARLRTGLLPVADDLTNTFERPLLEMLPELEILRQAFISAGAPFVALSGAGPTHYSIVRDLNDAISLAYNLRQTLAIPSRLLIARPVASGPLLRIGKTESIQDAL